MAGRLHRRLGTEVHMSLKTRTDINRTALWVRTGVRAGTGKIPPVGPGGPVG
jgi:hypothetical protein